MKANSLTVNTQKTTAFGSLFPNSFTTQVVSPARKSQIENSAVNTLFDTPWMALAESLREGMMLISRPIKPIYMNQQAEEICQKLAQSDRHLTNVPLAISEICHRLIKNSNSTSSTIISECLTAESETIRIRATWVNLPNSGDNSPLNPTQYILVFLENRSQILKEELQFEQQKYQLTEREIEIWSLLRQEYSYQEIAETLHISLNTVKTHVKNIYAKKRWHQLKDSKED